MPRLIELLAKKPLHNPVIVDVQNVYDWYMSLFDDPTAGKFSNWDDYTNVAPPWPNIFFEWDVEVRLPDEVWTTKLGIHFTSKPKNDPSFDHGWHFDAAVYEFGDSRFRSAFSYDGLIDETGQLSNLEIYEDQSQTEGYEYVYDVIAEKEIERNAVNVEALAMSHIRIALIALTFLNCHNVKTVDHIPTVTRQMRRHGGAPVVYKTLDIPGFKTEYGSPRSAGGDSSGRKFHLCRGYFAEHQNFFGKYGYRKVWVPTHTRGKLKKGVVLKDYRIKT